MEEGVGPGGLGGKHNTESRDRRRPSPGQLRDSNGPMLAALCRRLGWPVTLLSGTRDERSALERLFGGESATEADVLVPDGDTWLIKHRKVSTDWAAPDSVMARRPPTV